MVNQNQQSALADVQLQDEGDLASLLRKEFKPRTEGAEQAVEAAVKTLAEQALAGTDILNQDVVQAIESLIAAIDRKLGSQLDEILHHPDFQQLEGAWRGLHYMVNNTETDESLKIRVLNVTKKDLLKTFSKFKGTAWDQSPLFKQIYEQVSKEAWKMWTEHQKMLVNENRLSGADPKAREYLKEQMRKYFFGEGADQAMGYVPKNPTS